LKNYSKFPLSLLLFLTLGIHAEVVRDWVPLQEEKTITSTYLDINSIVYFQKEIVQAQYLVNFGGKPPNNIKNRKSAISTLEIDCNKKTKYRVMNIQWYEQNFAKGKFNEEKIINTVWYSPPFEASPKLVIKSLCQ